jgi:CheY-like chemotaxis protein
MGGTLTVRSTERVGSEFLVRLPATVAAAADLGPETAEPRLLPADVEAPAPTALEALDSPGLQDELRVLVAEDNPVNQRITQQLLRKRKLVVTLADDGRQAVDAFESGRFDLVLMDVQMPEMNGFEAVAAIRALEQSQGRPHTPIVAVTAHSMVGDREKCLEAGMDAYLAKPIRRQLLFELVDELLGTPDTKH